MTADFAALLATGKPIVIVANNKAEGSAPHSVVELAKAIVAGGRPADGDVTG